MIQNVLRHMGGIEVFGVVSILLFFACFLGVLIWTLTRTKPYLDSASRLPLEDGSTSLTEAAVAGKPDPCHE